MQTLSLYDDSLLWAGLFRTKSVNRSRILQEFFPDSSLLSFPKTVSLESCFLIRHPDLGNKVRNSFQRHSLLSMSCLPAALRFCGICRAFLADTILKRSFWGCLSSVHPCVKWHLKVAVPPSTCVQFRAGDTLCPSPLELEMSQKQRDFKDHLVPALLAFSIHVSGLAL